jgi:hypothetical protein
VEPSKIGFLPIIAPRFEFLSRATALSESFRNEWRQSVTISIANLQPIVALIAGVLILIMPRLLNYIVALYLILVGILGLGVLK